MIIFGWRNRLRALAQGVFFCPVDRSARGGVLLEARRWFTLFFIPVFPIRTVGRAVECTTCGTQFDERILTTDDSRAVAAQAAQLSAAQAQQGPVGVAHPTYQVPAA